MPVVLRSPPQPSPRLGVEAPRQARPSPRTPGPDRSEGPPPTSDRPEPLLTARQAAARLGVKPETLYAYVARGLIRSKSANGPGRAKRYAESEIESFITRRRGRRDPAAAAAGALFWGLPVVDSAVSCIDGAELFYRGQSATALAETASFEEVAALLWTGERTGRTAEPAPAAWPRVDVAEVAAAARAAREATASRTASPRETLLVLVAALATADAERGDPSPAAVAATARRLIVRAAAAFALASGASEARMERACSGSLAARVLAALRADDAGPRGALAAAEERDISRALVLSAEHELNASSFAARVAASTGADPYAVVSAAMATLGGPMHGGVTDRVEALVRAIGPADVATVVASHEARGEPLPGFGHRLYPDGDPRARPLLDAARARRAAETRTSRELDALLGLVDATAGRGEGAATVDFGLVATACSLRLPPGSAGVLFAFGRMAGWMAHAIEQYATREIIRPRARYVGVLAEGEWAPAGGGGAT